MPYRSLEVKGVLLRDLLVLTSLCALIFLTYAYIYPKTPTHIPL